MPKKKVIALGGLLLATLVFLIGGLQGTEFRGGRPFPSFGGSAPLSSPAPGNPGGADWLSDLLRLVLFGGVLFVALGLLFFRRFRRQLLRLIFGLVLMLVLWQFAVRRLATLEWEERPSEALPSVSGPEKGVGGEEVLPQPPHWAIYLGAGAAALALALWLGPRLLGAATKRQKRKAIQEIAKEAKAELQRGSPVLDVVLWAWARMVEILSARAGTQDRPSFTPREFAENLARLGFNHEAIGLLTELFEEVRYGRKESESRREKALAALAALEKTYA